MLGFATLLGGLLLRLFFVIFVLPALLTEFLQRKLLAICALNITSGMVVEVLALSALEADQRVL